jgi:cytochrome c nitrite reductase small subunit
MAEVGVQFLRSVITLRIIPPAWRMPSFLMLGMAAGAAVFVAYASRATSYLSDSPETCVNCHVMNTQYVTWQHSSHARVATCNDCHVPHDNILSHYAFKAKDGLWHATVFTMHWEPQVIRISKGAIPVVEANCRRCHEDVVAATDLSVHQSGDLRCWDCHREVPHGRVRSQAAGPSQFRPSLPGFREPMGKPLIGGRPPRPAP